MNPTAEKLTFAVPLSFEAHKIAKTLHQQHTNSHKAKQTYLNTLAVYAVDFYFRCMGIETDWVTSDSRNPILVESMDVADLKVKHLGKLECRPVFLGSKVCWIPPEVQLNRVGYIPVCLSQNLRQAVLLGFAQSASQVMDLT